LSFFLNFTFGVSKFKNTDHTVREYNIRFNDSYDGTSSDKIQLVGRRVGNLVKAVKQKYPQYSDPKVSIKKIRHQDNSEVKEDFLLSSHDYLPGVNVEYFIIENAKTPLTSNPKDYEMNSLLHDTGRPYDQHDAPNRGAYRRSNQRKEILTSAEHVYNT
jgi:hypothetical protein